MATSLQASSNAINARIRAIGKSANNLNKSIQECIIMIAEHAHGIGNGDCSGAGRLINALPKSVDRGAIGRHFAQYTPIRIGKDNKTGLVKSYLSKDKNLRYDLDGLRANDWWTRPDVESKIEQFGIADADADVIRLYERLEKRLKASEEQDSKRKYDVKDADRIRNLIADLKALAKRHDPEAPVVRRAKPEAKAA